jgi:hypothetical protein
MRFASIDPRHIAAACTCATLLIGASRADAQRGPWTDSECNVSSRNSNHSNNMSSSNDDGRGRRWLVAWTRGDCEVTVRASGDFTLSPDLAGIDRLDPGGYFEIEERRGSTVRRLDMTEGSNGVQQSWSLNGDKGQFDADKAEWLRGMLAAIDRHTAAFAKQRVPALLKQGGVDAVLKEISTFESDYARRVYFSELFAQAKLTDSEVRRTVKQVGDEIKSDYERTEVLRAIAARGPMNEATLLAFIDAAKGIGSDYEKRRALTAALASSAPGAQARTALFQAASSINSDYERAELLMGAERKGLVDSDSREAYFAAVGSIGSAYERRRALTALLDQHPKDKDVLKSILQAAGGIKSDHELGELLITFARAYPLEGDLREEFMRSAKHISSDYEYRRVLQAVVDPERRS